MTLLLVALAGGVGAATRFAADGIIARHNPFRVPLGTLVVNVSGSLVLGVLTGWAASGHAGGGAADLATVAGTGFCGGYTTFSTTAVETMRLWLAEGAAPGAGYAAATLLGSVAAAAAGLWVGGLAA